MNALIIIDMQEAYFKSPNLTGQKDQLVREANALMSKARQAGELVINVRTVHRRDKRTWTLNMKQDDQGFAFEGDAETQTLPGLALGTALELIKTRDSAFHGTDLLQILRDHNIDSIALAGVSAHSCIFHTAAAAYAYDFPVTLAQAAIGDEDEAQRQQTFEYLRREYRQEIL